MPLYDVKCKKCGFTEEVLQRGVDALPCSNCGSEVERLLGRSSFQLKGRGWANDLYGNPPPSAPKPDVG